jgi:hypothetical protein
LTDFIIAPLFVKFPLVADNVSPTRPYALIFFDVERKNKGIRARFVALLATKGSLINKGGEDKVCRKTILSNAELFGLGN